MKPRRHILSILAVLTILAGIFSCEKEDNDQQVYFEFYHVSYAWGFTNIHWIIDDKGNVRTSRNQDEVIQINENQINNCISLFDSIICKVDLNALEYAINLVPLAANGQVICQDMNGADIGTNAYRCFYSNEIVLLSSLSDEEACSNNSEAATEIENWLKQVNNSIFQSYLPGGPN
jgi:hypothetical protein